MTRKIAVYPGTFDPITNGHFDIVIRALRLFDHLIVAVTNNARKTPCFNREYRISLIKEAVAKFKHIQVLEMNGLLVDFVKQHHAQFVLRGLRAISDFDYEFQMAGMNHHMEPTIETIFLPTTQQHSFISATMVREIAQLGGDPSPFVPSVIAQKLILTITNKNHGIKDYR